MEHREEKMGAEEENRKSEIQEKMVKTRKKNQKLVEAMAAMKSKEETRKKWKRSKRGIDWS